MRSTATRTTMSASCSSGSGQLFKADTHRLFHSSRHLISNQSIVIASPFL
jgi:hypothetical protein